MLATSRIGGCAIQLEASGDVDERFAPVVDTFVDGFSEGRDVGAGVAVTIEGQLVVDLWGGYRDRRRTTPWARDTLCCLFSISKGVTATCVLQAVAEGMLQLDSPVSAHWPEFAQNGKEEITPRHLLTHQAGLIGFHEPVARDIYYDWALMCEALAKEHPWWVPGERHGYHARTFGFLLGELLRRATGNTPGQWLRERIAGPLGLDLCIGVAAEDLPRCAQMLPARVRPGELKNHPPAQTAMMRDFNDISTPTGAAFQNPSLGAGYMNSDAFRQVEMPAMNGHGTARALADMFGKIEQLLPAEILQQATKTHSQGPDAVLQSTTHFGLGYMLHHRDAPIGIRPGSFGHAGAGGSMAFYDPAEKLGYCFVMNQMQEGVVTGGTSATAVAEAVYRCL